MAEVERKQADLAGNPAFRGFPLETTSDHQVEHEKDVVLELHDYPLSKAAKFDERASLNR